MTAGLLATNIRPVRERFPLGYQPSLDGLRAVAISLVVLYHTGSGGARQLRGGLLGVDLFFALSGYLITAILLKEWGATGSIHLPRFYGRRLLRLAPALMVLVATLAFVTHVVYPEFAGTLRGRWAAATLLYVLNLLAAYGREYPLGHVSICWSLAIEEQFYLLWPIVLRTLLRRGASRGRVALMVLAASAIPSVLREILMRHAAGDPTRWLRVYFGSDTRADTLLIGCALGLVLAGRTPAWPRAGPATGVVAAGVLAWFAGRYDIADLVAHPLLFTATAIASAGLLFGVLQGGLLARVLSVRPLVWIGKLSYSLYLWHMVALGLTADLPFVGRAAVLVGLAAASYYLVERPFLAIKDRLHPSGAAAPRSPDDRASEGTPTATRVVPNAGSRPSAWAVAARTAVGLVVLALAVVAVYARGLPVAALGLLQHGDTAGAVRALERAAAWSPGSPGVLTTLGSALLRAGRHEDARARFEQVLQTHPDHALAWLGLGRVALERGRLAEAVTAFARSAALDPKSAAAHNGLGLALAQRGELEAAIRHFTEAARILPDPSILANLEKARSDLASRQSLRDIP